MTDIYASIYSDTHAGKKQAVTLNNSTILPIPITTYTQTADDGQTADNSQIADDDQIANVLTTPKSTIMATEPATQGLTAPPSSKADIITKTEPKPLEIDPETFNERQPTHSASREIHTHAQSDLTRFNDERHTHKPQIQFDIKGNIASTGQTFTSEIPQPSVNIRVPEIDTLSALSKSAVKPTAVITSPSVQHAAVQQVTDALIKRTEKTGDIVVRLDPAELGKVNITFTFEKAGSVTAHVVADITSTTAILRDRADMLHAQLKQSGFENINLSFDTQDRNQNDDGFGAQLSHHNKKQSRPKSATQDI